MIQRNTKVAHFSRSLRLLADLRESDVRMARRLGTETTGVEIA
jgi:hypothetical protein